MHIYDSLLRKKVEIEPNKRISMYVCGPTTYDLAHIGHARTTIFFDVLKRYLEYSECSVTYVSNVTDIDDKIINRAKEMDMDPIELSKKYAEEYRKDMKTLRVKSPNITPKVSQHIDIIIKFIEDLIEKGFAYESDGDVYFSVEKFSNYGKLSNRDIKEMSTKEDNDKKKSSLDFALWKNDSEGWVSPWGNGRPGWHIECSAMSTYYLGDTIDIHGGGNDLIFPHHENEIAQSEARTGKKFVNCWVHTGMVIVDKEKMSKSLGNFFTIRDVLKGYSPEVIRFFLLSTHYRKPLDYSKESLKEAKTTLMKIWNTYESLDNLSGSGIDIDKIIKDYREKFTTAMDNDLNTRETLTSLLEFCGEINKEIDSLNAENANIVKDFFNEINEIFDILPEKSSFQGEELIDLLIEIRNNAREKKDFETSDMIRDKLKEIGISLEDGKDSTRFKVR